MWIPFPHLNSRFDTLSTGLTTSQPVWQPLSLFDSQKPSEFRQLYSIQFLTTVYLHQLLKLGYHHQPTITWRCVCCGGGDRGEGSSLVPRSCPKILASLTRSRALWWRKRAGMSHVGLLICICQNSAVVKILGGWKWSGPFSLLDSARLSMMYVYMPTQGHHHSNSNLLYITHKRSNVYWRKHDTSKGHVLLLGCLVWKWTCWMLHHLQEDALIWRFFPGYKPFYILTFTSCFDVQKFFM